MFKILTDSYVLIFFVAMAYPDFYFIAAACMHVLGWSGVICVTICGHWSLDCNLHDNVSTGSLLIVWKMGPIKFQNHIICISLKLQNKYDLQCGFGWFTKSVHCEAFGVLRYWAPSGKSAGFHGGQAGAKKSQNYSKTFSTSLHSHSYTQGSQCHYTPRAIWHCTK